MKQFIVTYSQSLVVDAEDKINALERANEELTLQFQEGMKTLKSSFEVEIEELNGSAWSELK